MSINSEEDLFQIKSKFLREIPHPKLILKAINQTKSSEINFENELLDLEELNSTKSIDLKSFLKTNTSEILSVKLEIANSTSLNDLHLALKKLYKQQWSLVNTLAAYVPKLTVYPDDSIKLSEPIDAYLLTKFLDSTQLSENEIKTYICTSISNKLVEDFDVLTIACLRSRKIKVNAGSV